MTILEQLEGVLSWYQGCDAVAETLANINRELEPLGFVAHFDVDIIVVWRKPRVVPSKPVSRIAIHGTRMLISHNVVT